MACLSIKSKLRISLTTMAALVLFTGSSAAPVNKIVICLFQYGNLSLSIINPSIRHMVDESTMSHVIAEFQSFAGLKATGELDEETTKMMSLPKCGVPDKVFGHSSAKRYDFKWKKRKLTYKISKYPSGSELSHAQVEAELAKAFSVWTEYTDLTFMQESSEYVDIEIRFEKGDHGDGVPFDGPSSGTGISDVLAHTFLSEYGYVHFDDDELWTTNSDNGVNLYQVAVHEFGHVLGLDHSNDESAVMFPFIGDFDRLHQDDIQELQALYGPKMNKEQTRNRKWWWRWWLPF